MTDVLVADDEPDILDLIAFKLQTAGHRVHTAADGAEALALAEATAPDLAVLDVVMPRMSGLQVCQCLRAMPATAHLPVIMVTARSSEAEVLAGFEAGADDLLIKPFSPRELLTRVDVLLRRARGSALRSQAAASAAVASLAALRRLP